MLKRFLPRALLLAALSLSILACPSPLVPIAKKVIDCTLSDIKDKGLLLIPQVNQALTQDDWKMKLIRLISPAAGITEETLACVVRSSGSSYASSAEANPSDELSVKCAQRARDFILERGYKFQ